MLKHYIKYAIRNFKSNRLVFAGSIATVFLGALCISLLFTYIHNELSMNKLHKREKDIYLLTVQQSPESQVEAVEAELFFKFNYKDYPGIENFATVKKYKKGEIVFTNNETKLSAEGIVADSTFFEIFDFKMKAGNKNTVLHDPNAILLTEDFAKKLFENESPVGKAVKITERVEKVYTVKGIVESPPSNSSMVFDFIIPNHSEQFNRSGGNFILVNYNFNRAEFVAQIKDIGHKHEQFKDSRMDVMPLDDIYFNGAGVDFNGIFSKFGNRKSINILFAIIGVVFIITLLNFSNLQIISINSSLKNIGINKISGAGKKHIFYQKITELFFLITVSAVLITLAFTLVLP
ncbi:MAG TPA: ABC transporter permease, partial [Draconibacterium sp.]|nr:ABC transporter permease [Draconibacterium sp.]